LRDWDSQEAWRSIIGVQSFNFSLRDWDGHYESENEKSCDRFNFSLRDWDPEKKPRLNQLGKVSISL